MKKTYQKLKQGIRRDIPSVAVAVAGGLVLGSFFLGSNYGYNRFERLKGNCEISFVIDYVKEQIVLEADLGEKSLHYRESFDRFKDEGECFWDRQTWEGGLEGRAKTRSIRSKGFGVKNASYKYIAGEKDPYSCAKKDLANKYKVTFHSKK